MQEFFINTVIPWLLAALQGNPTLAPILLTIITIQGFCRIWLKPIMSAVVEFTNWTETQKDNEFLNKIMLSKWYKIVAYIVDWFLSVKLPQVVKNEISASNTAELANALNKSTSQK